MSEEGVFSSHLSRSGFEFSKELQLDAFSYFVPKTRSLSSLQLYVQTLWEFNTKNQGFNEGLHFALYECVMHIFQLKFEISEPFIDVETFIEIWKETIFTQSESTITLAQLSIICAILSLVESRLSELVDKNVIILNKLKAFQKHLWAYFVAGVSTQWQNNPKYVSFLSASAPKVDAQTKISSMIPRTVVSMYCLDGYIVPLLTKTDLDVSRLDSVIQRSLSYLVKYIELSFQNIPSSDQLQKRALETLLFKFNHKRIGMERDFVLTLGILLNAAYLEIQNDDIMKKIFELNKDLVKLGKFEQYTSLFKKCSYNILNDKLVEDLVLADPCEQNDLFLLEYLQYTKPLKRYIDLLQPYCTSGSLKSNIREMAHLAMLNNIRDNPVEISNYLNQTVLDNEQYRHLTEEQVLMIFSELLPTLTVTTNLDSTIVRQLDQINCDDPLSLSKLVKCLILVLIRKIAVESPSSQEIVGELGKIFNYIANYPERHLLLSFLWKELVSNKENWYDNESGIRWWYKEVLTSKL